MQHLRMMQHHGDMDAACGTEPDEDGLANRCFGIRNLNRDMLINRLSCRS
jgi:hypothetical protein